MCGILGAFGQEISPSQIEALRHRGPDGRGEQFLEVAGNQVCLGHTRLAILDLSPAGKQPMQSRDGRWWVSFNGEIYNHLELRKALDGPFRGHSDTETLVELIAAFGMEQALPRLNGMFAFAALDTKLGKLYLARDPFGIKPLYYRRKDDGFAFASEVRALRALGLVDGIDADGLRRFLTLRYVPSPATLWQGVQRLQPGHVLCLDIESGAVTTSGYIEPASERFHGSLEEAVEGYREALGTAVKRQLLADVPVGVLLSGGVDSALVAAMAKDAGQKLPCFSVGFGAGHPECELKEAEETASILDLPFTAVTVTPEKLREALPDIVRAVEEPLGTTSIMPMWYLVQRARQDVTVVLTGQGTDEPWGGYRRYQVEMVRRLLPFPGLWRLLKGLVGASPHLPEVVERGVRTLACRDLAERVVEACALFPAEERRLLLGEDRDGGAREAVSAWLRWLAAVDLDPAERMMRLDARMNLADDLLLYGDKISMAVSLEARVPMLDIDLVRFVESLPLEYRAALRRAKIAHKKMAAGYLPERIVHRRKKGFQVPFGAWSRGSWKGWVEERLLDARQPHLQGLQRGGVERLWRQHLQGRPDRSRQVFALLMLALWWEENR